jgi:hypothetical protein
MVDGLSDAPHDGGVSRPTIPGIATLTGAAAAKLATESLHLAPGQHPGFVVAAATATTATTAEEAEELTDLITAARSVLARERTTREGVMRALLPTFSDLGATPAVLAQIHRNAQARTDLATGFGLLSSADVAERAGSTARNDPALAHRWRTEGKVFTVDDAGAQRFPGFQFDEDGRPYPLIAEVLALLGVRLGGWELALWFTSSSDWLGGQLRPVDVLDRTRSWWSTPPALLPPSSSPEQGETPVAGPRTGGPACTGAPGPPRPAADGVGGGTEVLPLLHLQLATVGLPHRP